MLFGSFIDIFIAANLNKCKFLDERKVIFAFTRIVRFF